MAQRILETGNEIAIQRPITSVPRNSFNFDHDAKLSCNIGELAPVAIMEALPGDIFHFQCTGLVRLQPMLFPVMHRLKVRTEAFFVPYRLLWPNFESLISPPIVDMTPPAMPYLAPDVPTAIGTRADYFGIPTVDPTGAVYPIYPKVNALIPAAYEKLVCDWYTDEDLNPTEFQYSPLTDGDNTGAHADYLTGSLHLRNYDRDYFTSAKPFAQKGDAVVIPLFNDVQGSLNVFYQTAPGAPTGLFRQVSDGTPANSGTITESATGPNFLHSSGTPSQGIAYDPNGTLGLNLTEVMSAAGTIEELRRAEALQKFLEADSRGGTRYIEVIKQHWDVESSDARLQRAEYICSSTQQISISEVLNTTGTSTAPQGSMAGHGIAVPGHTERTSYHCEEFGVIFVIASVLPDTGYFQGLHPMFRRFDRLDFPWPEFAQLGEQIVENGEIFYDPTDPEYTGVNAGTWGYLPRYTEFRMPINRVSGDFRTTQNAWHMARLFAGPGAPPLVADFLKCVNDEALERIFAVIDPTVDHLLMHWFNQVTIERKLPRLVRPTI